MLIIRGALWVRLLFGMIFGVGVLCAFGGVALGASGDWAQAALLLALGVLLLPIGWLGARSRVRVDRRGVLYAAFRTTFVPAAEIDSFQVRPVPGLGPVDRAQITVVRKDGSEVRLDPTEVVRSGPDHAEVLGQIKAMQRALGRNSDGVNRPPGN